MGQCGWVRSSKGLAERGKEAMGTYTCFKTIYKCGVCEFFGFNPRGYGEKVEVERSLVWLYRTDAWEGIKMSCLTEIEK